MSAEIPDELRPLAPPYGCELTSNEGADAANTIVLILDAHDRGELLWSAIPPNTSTTGSSSKVATFHRAFVGLPNGTA